MLWEERCITYGRLRVLQSPPEGGTTYAGIHVAWGGMSYRLQAVSSARIPVISPEARRKNTQLP